MALEKTGYKAAIQGTTKVRIPLDENGYIAPEGTLSASTKQISVTKVSADNSLQDNTDVIDFFMDLANGRSYSDTNTMSVTWETGVYSS